MFSVAFALTAMPEALRLRAPTVVPSRYLPEKCTPLMVTVAAVPEPMVMRPSVAVPVVK